MSSRKSKLRILDEVLEVLQLDPDNMERLPALVATLAQRATTQPVVVCFAFDPIDGKLLQVALSSVPATAKNYQALSKVTTELAQQFQNVALEVAKNAVAEEKRVGGGTPGGQDDEPRVGPGPEGHGVGEMAPPGPGAGNSNE